MLKRYVAVIQAGGQGTRLRNLTKDRIPKPMLLLNGKPMLEWQIDHLMKYGISEFVIICGYLGEKIKEYFQDGRSKGIRIRYIDEEFPMGSAGALFFLKEEMFGRDFVLIFGDVMFDVDMVRMTAFHERRGAMATLLVHPNSHPQDSDLVVLDENQCVIDFDSKQNVRNYWYHNLVNAGIYILNGDCLKLLKEADKYDLEKDLLLPLIKTNRLYGYRTTEYVKDAGTEERFIAVQKDQAQGLWNVKNLSAPQKCVFLDRDGTVNKYKGLISEEGQLELEPCAAEAIKLLNQSKYLVIIVTNQPVVARGLCGIEDVNNIHRKMETLLGEQGAYVDDIIFCPHHPDKGYQEENPIYKVKCSCRKPNTGMIDEMVFAYNIDCRESYIIGDSTVDLKTGSNAGLQTILVHTGQSGKDGKYDVEADYEADDLLAAVKWILKEGK